MKKQKLIKQWSQDLKKHGMDNWRDWYYLTYTVRKNLNIKVPKTMGKRKIRYLSLDETKQILKIAYEMQKTKQMKVNGLIVETMIKTGLGNKQMINLKIENIDFDSQHFKIKIKNKDYYGIITNSLNQKLKDQIKNRKKGYLFLNNKNKQFSIRSMQLIIKHIKLQSKIKKQINPQTLSNVFGTILMQEGIDKDFLENLKRKKNIIGIYTHMLIGENKK